MLVVISGGSQGLGLALATEHVKQGDSVVIVARTQAKLEAAVDALELVRDKVSTQAQHEPEPIAADLRLVQSSKHDETATGPSDQGPHLSQGEWDDAASIGGLSAGGDSILSPPGQTIRAIAADVSIPADCRRVFGEVGYIPDKVYCCAGAANPGLFLEQTSEQLTAGLRTVYETALHFSHAALQVMSNAPDKQHNRRMLVYCSSTLGVFPFIGYGSYAPGKAAIRALADIVRQECIAHNIRVAHIIPGSMATEGFDIEERTKPVITKQIEGPSKPLDPEVVAQQVLRDLGKGNDTIYTDNVTLILGSMMLGTSPRVGWGILQTLWGLLLALAGPFVAWSVNNDIKKWSAGQKDAAEDAQLDIANEDAESPSESAGLSSGIAYDPRR